MQWGVRYVWVDFFPDIFVFFDRFLHSILVSGLQLVTGQSHESQKQRAYFLFQSNLSFWGMFRCSSTRCQRRVCSNKFEVMAVFAKATRP